MESNNHEMSVTSSLSSAQQIENLVGDDSREKIANEANALLTNFANSTKERTKTLLEKKAKIDKKKGYYEGSFEEESNQKTAQSIKTFIGIPTAESIKEALTALNSLYTQNFKDQAEYTADLYNYITEIQIILKEVIFMEAIAFNKIKGNTNSIRQRAEKINELSARLEKGTCSTNDLLDFVIESTSEVEESNQKFSDELTQLSENLLCIKEKLKKTANIDQLSLYALIEHVYSREEIDNLLKKKANNDIINKFADRDDISKKINRVRIAYITTTAILTIGLIISFLI